MSKIIGTSGSRGITRRGFGSGALGTGLLLGTGRAPAIAQGKRDLRVGVFGGEFGNLSPVIRYDIQGGLVVYNIFDLLLKIDFAKHSMVPLLALEWANPSPLVWRVKLREGVKWHKGFGEFTADDVAYTINYHLESRSFQVGTALFAVDTVKADGKHVVEFKTKQPFGAFPGITLGYGGLTICQKAHKEMGNDAYSAMPIGTGPFQIESKRGTEIVLVEESRLLAAWPRRSSTGSSIDPFPIRRRACRRFQKGELDFVTHPDPEDIKALRKDGKFTVQSTPGWEWDYQQFNLKTKPDAAYQKKAVRQAISYAIDREAIVNEIYYGEALATDSQIPAGYLGHRKPMMKYPKNGDLKNEQGRMEPAGRRRGVTRVEVITSDNGLAAQGTSARRAW